VYCPEFRAEYAAGFTQCSDCGVDLVDDVQVAARSAETRHRPPTPPDVSAYVSGGGRTGPLSRYGLAWFIGLPLIASVALALVGLQLVAPYSVATGLAALLVCWAVGRRQDVPANLALRVSVFVLVCGGYLLATSLVEPGLGGLGGPWTSYYLPLAVVGGLLVQATLSPNRAVRRLARPLVRWRAPWHVYAVAILVWPLITVLVVELSRHLPGAQAEVANGGFIGSAIRLAPLDALWLGPWAVGWFGYGVPMLLRRRSALTASLVLGAATGLALAIPTFVHGHLGGPGLYLDIVEGLAVAVIAVWLFQRARGSVWPVLFLVAANASALLLNWAGDGFGRGDYGTWVAVVVAEVLFAAALVVLGRMWLRPQDFPTEPRAEGRPDDSRDGPEPASTRLIDGGAA